jgi:hypothetical protein
MSEIDIDKIESQGLQSKGSKPENFEIGKPAAADEIRKLKVKLEQGGLTDEQVLATNAEMEELGRVNIEPNRPDAYNTEEVPSGAEQLMDALQKKHQSILDGDEKIDLEGPAASDMMDSLMR